jgi:hypothetical protein
LWPYKETSIYLSSICLLSIYLSIYLISIYLISIYLSYIYISYIYLSIYLCHVRAQLEGTAYKPGKELSIGFSHVDTLITNFHAVELWENKCLLFKLLSLFLWFFVMAAWTSKDRCKLVGSPTEATCVNLWLKRATGIGT